MCNCELLQESSFWKDHLLEIIAISLALLTFGFERYWNFRREKQADKYQWFLTIIIEPHLEEIKNFYEETFKDLSNACKNLKQRKGTIGEDEHAELVRSYCDSFKNRRRSFFNNFVSMISSFDTEMASKVDEIINLLDDCYVNAIDKAISKEDESNELINKIYKNKADLYQTLFKKLHSPSKSGRKLFAKFFKKIF